MQGTHTNPAFAQQARPLQCHSTLEYSYKEDMWAFIKPKPAATALEKAQDVLCLSASMVMGQSANLFGTRERWVGGVGRNRGLRQQREVIEGAPYVQTFQKLDINQWKRGNERSKVNVSGWRMLFYKALSKLFGEGEY